MEMTENEEMASARDEEYELEYGCSPCDCPSLTQQRISILIEKLMLHCKSQNSLRLTIDFQTFIFICHKVIEAFMRVGTVEYVHDPRGVGIYGDLHGSFPDLMKGMMRTGWPTERTLIFMGDYVDRGNRPLQVVLFLFFCLRYAIQNVSYYCVEIMKRSRLVRTLCVTRLMQITEEIIVNSYARICNLHSILCRLLRLFQTKFIAVMAVYRNFRKH